MSDFTSDFWNWYVALITVLSIAGCAIPSKKPKWSLPSVRASACCSLTTVTAPSAPTSLSAARAASRRDTSTA